MKKIITLLAIPALLASGCSTDQVMSEVEAKELAATQIDGVLASDIDNIELLETKNGVKFYRIKEKLYDSISYEIDMDAHTGDFLQVETETTNVGTNDVGKEAIKNKIFELLPGCNDFDIFSLNYIEDDEEVDQPYYLALVLLNDKGYEYIFDAKSGEKLYEEVYDLNEEYTEEVETNKPISRKGGKEQPYYRENRPIYVQGHRCNTNYKNEWRGSRSTLLPEKDRKVANALNHGCNGVEVDLRHRACDNTIRLCHDNSITIFNSESLEDFLSLPEMRDPRLTLILYDIKEPEYIKDIMEITHEFQDNDAFAPLGEDGKPIEGAIHKINFIYSCDGLYGSFGRDNNAHRYFPTVVKDLRPNEGMCIDYENDWNAVNNFFRSIECPRSWYGNGIFSGVYGKGTINGCKNAVRIRDAAANPYDFKGVESWTCHQKDDLVTRLNWGLDSSMVDGPQHDGDFVTQALKEIRGAHLATRSDSPFYKKS